MEKKCAHMVQLTDDGTWCWLADPRAIFHKGRRHKTYTGWVNRWGDIQIGSYDHRGGEKATFTLREHFNADDHANPALLMLPDGRLMVFYSSHAGNRMYYRISDYSEDITSWGPELELNVHVKGSKGFTYPNPVCLKSENNRIYLFWRGADWQPTFSTSPDRERWEPVRTLFLNQGQRPYLKIFSQGTDTIHFAWTDGHPQEVRLNNIYYAYYKNGAFYRADHAKIKNVGQLPLVSSESDKVYDASLTGHLSWIWDIAVNPAGHPVIVYATFPAIDDHRYHYAFWNGRVWTQYEITKGGGSIARDGRGREPWYSGGIVLDHLDPSIVYLSREVKGIHEIERWRTPDEGRSWVSTFITTESSKNNIRPIVARGSSALIWMHGEYFHYTNFKTQLVMTILD